MKIEFARTGGVAGVALTLTLDTETLPLEEVEHLRRLMAAASFFDLPALLRSVNRGADRFQYRVTVEDGNRINKVELDEASVPEKCRPLLDYLIDSARAARRAKRS